MPASIQPIGASRVRDRTLQALKDAIFTGQLPPGEPLREIGLARQLQVSQATVHDALVKLEHLGLVMRSPEGNSAVTRLTEDEVRQRILIRVSLESLAAVEAGLEITPDGFLLLKERLLQLRQCADRQEPFESAQADLEFHRTIWQLARNPTLERILDQLTAPLFAFVIYRMRQTGGQNFNQIVESHDPIMAALERREPRAIAAAVRDHIMTCYGPYFGEQPHQVEAALLTSLQDEVLP